MRNVKIIPVAMHATLASRCIVLYLQAGFTFVDCKARLSKDVFQSTWVKHLEIICKFLWSNIYVYILIY